MKSEKPIIGFIGLGLMGSGMAQNLLKAGYKLNVYNRTRAKANEFVRQGAFWQESPKNLAERSDYVITMVSDPPALKQVMLGENGVMKGIRKGSVIIDMSTVDPATTLSMAAEAAKRGVDYLDAPVTGGDIGAAEGTLTIMVGSSPESFDKCKPVLLSMGKKLIHAGPVGQGSYMKLFNNLLLAGCFEAFSEAMVFGVKAGLATEQMMELIQSGFLACRLFDIKGNAVLKRYFTQHFSTALMHKDISLGLITAKSLQVSMPALAVTNEIYNAAEAGGLSQEDYCSTIKVHEELSKVTVEQKK